MAVANSFEVPMQHLSSHYIEVRDDTLSVLPRRTSLLPDLAASYAHAVNTDRWAIDSAAKVEVIGGRYGHEHVL